MIRHEMTFLLLIVLHVAVEGIIVFHHRRIWRVLRLIGLRLRLVLLLMLSLLLAAVCVGLLDPTRHRRNGSRLILILILGRVLLMLLLNRHEGIRRAEVLGIGGGLKRIRSRLRVLRIVRCHAGLLRLNGWSCAGVLKRRRGYWRSECTKEWIIV